MSETIHIDVDREVWEGHEAGDLGRLLRSLVSDGTARLNYRASATGRREVPRTDIDKIEIGLR